MKLHMINKVKFKSLLGTLKSIVVLSTDVWSSVGNSSYLCSMSMKMKGVFDKYYGSIDKANSMMLAAVALDPQFKLKI